MKIFPTPGGMFVCFAIYPESPGQLRQVTSRVISFRVHTACERWSIDLTRRRQTPAFLVVVYSKTNNCLITDHGIIPGMTQDLLAGKQLISATRSHFTRTKSATNVKNGLAESGNHTKAENLLRLQPLHKAACVDSKPPASSLRRT